MNNYQILLDVWEGRPVQHCDWSILTANGVAGAIVRLNDIHNGHHKDVNFDAAWNFLEGKLRAPYFVLNPWVSGKENFNWLQNNTDFSHRVFIDIEVKKADVTPRRYADLVDEFFDYMGERATGIYTGYWFLQYVARWPTHVPYWWAGYSTQLTNCKTWDAYKRVLSGINYANWVKNAPGGADNVPIWQCSGDGCYLPGFGNRDIDVNVVPGSYEQVKNWLLGLPVPETTEEKMVTLPIKKVLRNLNVRKAPAITAQIVDRLPINSEVVILDNQAQGNNRWLRVGINQWIAEIYNGVRYVE